MADGFANGPTIGYGLIKKSIQAAHTNSLDEQLDVEAAHQKICGESPIMPRVSRHSSTNVRRTLQENQNDPQATRRKICRLHVGYR